MSSQKDLTRATPDGKVFGVNLDLPEDHRLFRDTVREFAEGEIAPIAEELDRTSTFPLEELRKAGELGLLGIPFPEEYGGAGADTLSYALAIEELGRIDSSFAITVAAHTSLGTSPIYLFGDERQKAEWLTPLASGRALAAFGLTEPEAGSDAGATRTKARLEGGEWVLNGAKAFITNSGTDIPSVVTVTARTGQNDDGTPQISAIMVPAGTPGFTVETAYDKLGWHASDTHGLSFSDCRVPADHLLGQQGNGFKQFLKTLDDGRIAISALAVGLAQACLEASTDYARTRIAFGRPIGVNQGVSFQIADLAVMVEAARALTYKAAWLKDELHAGRRSVAEVKQAAAVCKLYSTEAAVSATRIATQVFGGNGFMEEYPVARFYRDAKILEIGEGTSEVQRMVIARGLGLPSS